MSLRRKATRGLVWTFTQQFGNQLIGFLVSLILARILMPEQFGLIGMISVVMAVANSLLDGGTTNSLIRDPDCEESDYSTVFFFHFGVSILMYGMIYISSPLIAEFYEQPVLVKITRVYSISIIINALSIVQFAKLTKKMDFKTQTIISIPSVIFGGVIGIWMAYSGYGVWSLVFSNLATVKVKTIQIWGYSKWIPIFAFERDKFLKHFDYGYKLTISDLLNRIFNNIFLIAIGKYFSAAQVGFYTRAETMNQLPVRNISRTLEKVTFPLFVSIQNDDKRLKRVYKQIMQMVVYVVSPFLIYLAILAEPVFRFLFTEKWLPAVPYFQILCVTGLIYPLHSYNLDILNVKGRSDLFLKIEIMKKLLILISLVITVPMGIKEILYGQVIISIIAFFINAGYTGKFIGYNAFDQLKDVIPLYLFSCAIGVAVFILDNKVLYDQSDIIRIFSGGFVGLISYFGLSKIFKLNIFVELNKMIAKR
ncbi:lipopolysaccharide biosynthesis protein [Gramella lutea]|uniref:Lipopolysaccharide biosynthesis protein n=1 Tax=Christiangramia lutea TaxID=1607951 RepID=A0A9X1V6E2_9FLAO|nr:lipopolysaccharide biosynthesis protein [Christiangramia lutea]MCH4823784.1 lipopolysaccharide biosynthesis protein [Christiangramia lutea]